MIKKNKLFLFLAVCAALCAPVHAEDNGLSMDDAMDIILSRHGVVTDMNVADYLTLDAEEMPTGGADPSLGITGAQVEQIAKITAVDETGKPTAWEPMDIPSGGSDISLGLTAATVGQAIKVKAVDTDGKPTAWESVTPETWNFVMADGTTVTKKVYVDANK